MLQNEKVCFSGVQPSGNLTIGNYLGAIKNFAAFSSEYRCFYCVVDEHAITVRRYRQNCDGGPTKRWALYIAWRA